VLVCILAVSALAVTIIPARKAQKVAAGTCTTKCAPPPPPPPTVGQLGGPVTGLTSSITALFNGGYTTFAIKWDPIRGLGPVSTRTGCFTCHGAGVDVLTGTAGDTSNITGTRYGKWNPDNTFNYLDGNGTYPENEGGPTVHGLSNGAFGTLPGCNAVRVASSPIGASESGTTVTITTLVVHQFLAGQTAQILNVPVLGYNGTFTIASVPSPTTFTYTTTATGLAPSGGGTAQNLPHEVVPTDATVVSTVRSPQLFGDGLIDNIPDSAILANAATSKPLGITGVPNMVPDENGVVRPGKFGQKGNIVSLFQFIANAEFNELGITNTNSLYGVASAFFPTEHLPQGLPFPNPCQTDPDPIQDVNQVNMIKMDQFIALLAPIAPQPSNSSIAAGQVVFETIGCSYCHVQSYTTNSNVKLPTTTGGHTAVISSLSNVSFNPYSDFLLHDMGPGESGGIPYQPSLAGQASMTMWRTAPLWGLNNSLAKSGGLMHDLSATTINNAIQKHGGEAQQVINLYNGLNQTDSANLLAFLGSL
jgi:CxxC motif-containing protein (DUF1111 family)